MTFHDMICISKQFLMGRVLTEEQKFQLVYSMKVHPEVVQYLSSIFQNLTISILGKCQGNILDLMHDDSLIRWCWETTNTASLFLNNEDFIERGTIILEEPHLYKHSWISFLFQGKEYVFDPCLNVLCLKAIYYKIFKPQLFCQVSSKDVKDYFLEQIRKSKTQPNDVLSDFFASICGTEEFDRQRSEIVIQGSEEIADPFFRGNVGYTPELEENKIKKLVAHYYYYF